MNKHPAIRIGLKGMAGLAVLFVIVVALVYGANLMAQRVDAHAVAKGIANFQPYFLALRVGVLVLFLTLWPAWARRLAEMHELDADRTRALCEERWNIAGWLVLMDVLIVEGGLRAIIQGIGSLF